MIFMTYNCRKTQSIRIFGCISVYVYTAGVLLRQYFQKEIVDDSAVSGVFAVIGELCVDMGRPQPRVETNVVFCSMFVFEGQDCSKMVFLLLVELEERRLWSILLAI